MMQKGTLVILVAVCLGAGEANAQGGAIDSQCRAGTLSERFTQDACQKAIDLFQFMAPQLGVIIVGGNAVLGEHSAMRGPGHFSVGLRANAIASLLPQGDSHTPAITGATRSDYAVDKQVIGAPVLDAAVGLFRGFPVAGTYALGVDALVNVAYIPSVDRQDVKLELPDGSFKFGFGGRLGVMQETFLTPGLAVTYLRRDLPTVNVLGRVNSDELNVRDVQVQSSAWRAVLGKNFSVFGISLGAGQDRYETSAGVQVSVDRAGQRMTSSVVQAEQIMTRRNVFANLSLNLSVLRLVGEVGRVTGGKVSTYNAFGGHDANGAIDYASFGLRVNW